MHKTAAVWGNAQYNKQDDEEDGRSSEGEPGQRHRRDEVRLANFGDSGIDAEERKRHFADNLSSMNGNLVPPKPLP